MSERSITAMVIISVVVLGVLGMAGLPRYRVWSEGMAGTAELRRAEYNRQIVVEEAQAELNSAKLLAAAEVERARGVAEANEIIGDSLKGNDVYIRYLWVQTLNSGNHQLVYVPTEANLPILEAGRDLP